jgi:hypothetical protein
MDYHEKIHKRSHDIYQTFVSIDNQQEPITHQNWTDVLNKYRIELAQMNMLHDEVEKDETLKQFAIFPKEDKFREQPDRCTFIVYSLLLY